MRGRVSQALVEQVPSPASATSSENLEVKASDIIDRINNENMKSLLKERKSNSSAKIIEETPVPVDNLELKSSKKA